MGVAIENRYGHGSGPPDVSLAALILFPALSDGYTRGIGKGNKNAPEHLCGVFEKNKRIFLTFAPIPI
nr:hypothetical protein [uncultured Dysosmobacter sp.]